jgi:PAS domain S-box-containing protein
MPRLDSQTLFEKLFAFSPDAIVVADREGRITEANTQVERLFGYTFSELLGHPVEILIPERFRQFHPTHRAEYSSQPRMRPMGAGLELYGRRKDGSEFPVDIMLSPVETAGGLIVLGVIRDVSERKQKDEELRKSRAMFEDLFESSPDAIIEASREGLIVRVNAQVESIFGYSRGELIAQPINMLVPERFRRAHLLHLERYHADPRTRAMGAGLDLYGLRKDGSEFPVEIMLSPLRIGESLALAVVRDVTQRKQAEETLRRSEQQFRSIVNSVEDYAIFLLDAKGHVTSWNPGAEQIKGYQAEEIIGRNFACFYTSDDIDRGRPGEALHTAAQLGRYEDEGWRVRKDGSRFWANVIVTAIKDSSGQILGFSKVSRDLTVRKKTEDALMLELSKSVLSSLDIRNLLSALSAGIRHVIPNDYATVALYDRETDRLRIHVLEVGGTSGPAQEEVLLPLKRSTPGHVFTSREPLVLSNFKDERFDPEAFQYLNAKHLKSGCWVPLVCEERILGTLMVASYEEAAFTQRDLEVLGHLANQVAIGIDNMVAVGEFKRLSEKLAEEKQHLEQEVRVLEEDLRTEYGFDEIIGHSVGLKRVLKQVETVASTDATVLILGETGTGKELIARAIHHLSPRGQRSIIKLNCAAIPSGLLESELFGHEKGAFTGALSQKIGRLELAHQGTLFLDEIGDLPLELQPKILRALQEKEFERLGSARTIPVDVRLIAATNRDLGKMVAEKQFRSDLYYRLKVFPITIPPLRDRREDIPLLVRYFVDRHARRLNRGITAIPADVMQALTNWDWPGNIRELENFMERAVILSRGPALRAPLSELIVPELEHTPVQDSPNLQSAEREHILRILRETKGMIGGPGGAADRLGVKRTTLNSKLKKLGITRTDYI